MDIRIIDRERHVTRVPTKGPPFDGKVTDILDGLLNGSRPDGHRDLDNTNPAIEFECDGEFWSAFAPYLGTVDTPWREGHKAMYRNVPIVVVGGEVA
jgi:hypothetical protein